MFTIGREGGSAATNLRAKILHTENRSKVEGQETVLTPSQRAAILTVKTRRTDEATVKISAF